jgi:hypothetical protein
VNHSDNHDPNPPFGELSRLFASVFGQRQLLSANLSGPRLPGSTQMADAEAPTAPLLPETGEPLRRVEITPITIKGKKLFQFGYQHARKITHRNLPPREAAGQAEALLASAFKQATLRTADTEYQVLIGKDGRPKIHQRRIATPSADENPNPPADTPHDNHDRTKNYLLREGEPYPFLVRLGVMTSEGAVIAARRDKFKQINRYLETVVDVASAFPPDQPLTIVDFGSGKSYLTFALYHLLAIEQKRPDVRIVGLDLKADVIAGCERIARDLNFDGLSFAVGDIKGYAGPPEGRTVDMVVSLHACDTATDDALAQAIGWNARCILAVPCCQHELFKKLADDTPLRP